MSRLTPLQLMPSSVHAPFAEPALSVGEGLGVTRDASARSRASTRAPAPLSIASRARSNASAIVHPFPDT